jgi:imidazolonepropionase-like amidohydrolase
LIRSFHSIFRCRLAIPHASSQAAGVFRGLFLLLLLALPLRGQQLIVHNVTVIDGHDARRALDVVIEGERIARVGACREHGQARVIDATDMFLAAGFIDMREQLFLHRCDESDELEVRYDHGAIARLLQMIVVDRAHDARGTIAPGAAADLVLLARNSFGGDADVGAIDLIIARGRLVSPHVLLGR